MWQASSDPRSHSSSCFPSLGYAHKQFLMRYMFCCSMLYHCTPSSSSLRLNANLRFFWTPIITTQRPRLDTSDFFWRSWLFSTMRQRLKTFRHFGPAASFCYTWRTLETAFSSSPLHACCQQLWRNPEEKTVCGNVGGIRWFS